MPLLRNIVARYAAARGEVLFEVTATHLVANNMDQLVRLLSLTNPPRAPLTLRDLAKRGRDTLIIRLKAPNSMYEAQAENWVYNALISVSSRIPEFRDLLSKFNANRELQIEALDSIVG